MNLFMLEYLFTWVDSKPQSDVQKLVSNPDYIPQQTPWGPDLVTTPPYPHLPLTVHALKMIFKDGMLRE